MHRGFTARPACFGKRGDHHAAIHFDLRTFSRPVIGSRCTVPLLTSTGFVTPAKPRRTSVARNLLWRGKQHALRLFRFWRNAPLAVLLRAYVELLSQADVLVILMAWCTCQLRQRAVDSRFPQYLKPISAPVASADWHRTRFHARRRCSSSHHRCCASWQNVTCR